MALISPRLLQPQRDTSADQEQESSLDKITKGLAALKTGFGIAADIGSLYKTSQVGETEELKRGLLSAKGEREAQLGALEIQEKQERLAQADTGDTGQALQDQLNRSRLQESQSRFQESQKRIAKAQRKEEGILTPTEEREREVPGFGIALTKQDAKKAKQMIEDKNAIKDTIKEMKKLRDKHGGELFDREAVARGKTMGTRLLLKMKDMFKLGVLSISDEKLLDDLVPRDPLEFNVPGFQSTVAKMDELENMVDRDFSTFLKVAGLTPEQPGVIAGGKEIRGVGGVLTPNALAAPVDDKRTDSQVLQDFNRGR